MNRCAVLLLILAGQTVMSTPAHAQLHSSDHHAFRVDTVVAGLEHPWSVAFLPDGGMLVTERPGRLRVVRDGRLEPEPVAGVPAVHARGQGGLLDVLLHPEHASNRLVYLSYSKPGPQGATTAVIRGRLEGSRITDVEEILEARAWGGGRVHFGSRMVFDRDGYLYITVGERGERDRAQDLSRHNGKTLRLHDDGSVPRDNPFVGEEGVLPEIFAYGIRSPQGLTLHPETGELWETEHGPRGGDEINVIRAGRNYGWPVITYGVNYDGTSITEVTAREGMEQPLHYWVPSIATSGIAVYSGAPFPQWRGDVFVGGLAGAHLARIRFAGGRVVETERLLEGVGRVRDVRVGPDGLLYVLIDAPDAPLLRLVPTAG